jgi:hypothetical protein
MAEEEDAGFQYTEEEYAGFHYNSFAFNGISDEQQMHAEFETWLEETLSDAHAEPDPVSEDPFQHQFEYQGWSVVDHYFGYEKFDDNRLVFYMPSDTGSMFNVSEGYDDGPRAARKHAYDQLLLEIRLSLLLNRLRCH